MRHKGTGKNTYAMEHNSRFGGGRRVDGDVRDRSKRTNQSAVRHLQFWRANHLPWQPHHLFREVTNAPLSCPTRWPISHNCATLISKSGRRGDTGRANTDSYRALVPSKDEEVIENITNSSQGIKIHNRTLARPSLMRHLHR